MNNEQFKDMNKKDIESMYTSILEWFDIMVDTLKEMSIQNESKNKSIKIINEYSATLEISVVKVLQYSTDIFAFVKKLKNEQIGLVKSLIEYSKRDLEINHLELKQIFKKDAYHDLAVVILEIIALVKEAKVGKFSVDENMEKAIAVTMVYLSVYFKPSDSERFIEVVVNDKVDEMMATTLNVL